VPERGFPSKAANGLETGFGACVACDDCARARSAEDGIVGLATRGAIVPVVFGRACDGRGVGSGTSWAIAEGTIMQTNKAAIAVLRPVRALWCPAITFSARRSLNAHRLIWAGCGDFATQQTKPNFGLIAKRAILNSDRLTDFRGSGSRVYRHGWAGQRRLPAPCAPLSWLLDCSRSAAGAGCRT
jgi:hypothetical protein